MSQSSFLPESGLYLIHFTTFFKYWKQVWNENFGLPGLGLKCWQYFRDLPLIHRQVERSLLALQLCSLFFGLLHSISPCFLNYQRSLFSAAFLPSDIWKVETLPSVKANDALVWALSAGFSSSLWHLKVWVAWNIFNSLAWPLRWMKIPSTYGWHPFSVAPTPLLPYDIEALTDGLWGRVGR